jgi:hypothetical protein
MSLLTQGMYLQRRVGHLNRTIVPSSAHQESQNEVKDSFDSGLVPLAPDWDHTTRCIHPALEVSDRHAPQAVATVVKAARQ